MLAIVCTAMLLLALPDDLTRAIDVLSRAKVDKLDGVAEALAIVDEHLTPDDGLHWQRAFDIVRSAERPMQLRIAMLRTIGEKSHATQGVDLVRLADAWALELQTTPGLDPDLLHTVIVQLNRPDLWNSVRSAPDTAVLLGHVVNWRTQVDPEIRRLAMTLLATCTAPKQAVRQAVIDAIRSGATIERFPPELVPLLDGEVRRELRKITCEAKPLHCVSAAGLAHVGDLDIRDELVRRRDHGDRADLADLYLWQIDVQRSKEGLLGRIGAMEGTGGPVGQRWALRRANELGIDRAAIREAVLAFAEKAKPLDFKGKQHPAAAVIDLKDLALQLGVLEPNDLPNIPAPIRVEP